jgi:hypothetical protein
MSLIIPRKYWILHHSRSTGEGLDCCEGVLFKPKVAWKMGFRFTDGKREIQGLLLFGELLGILLG